MVATRLTAARAESDNCGQPSPDHGLHARRGAGPML